MRENTCCIERIFCVTDTRKQWRRIEGLKKLNETTMMIREHMREIRVCTKIAKNMFFLLFIKNNNRSDNNKFLYTFCKNNGCDSSFFLFLKIWQMRLAWHCIFPPLRSFPPTSTQQSQCNVRRGRERIIRAALPPPSSPFPSSQFNGWAAEEQKKRLATGFLFFLSHIYCEFPHGGLENWKGDFFFKELDKGMQLVVKLWSLAKKEQNCFLFLNVNNMQWFPVFLSLLTQFFEKATHNFISQEFVFRYFPRYVVVHLCIMQRRRKQPS